MATLFVLIILGICWILFMILFAVMIEVDVHFGNQYCCLWGMRYSYYAFATYFNYAFVTYSYYAFVAYFVNCAYLFPHFYPHHQPPKPPHYYDALHCLHKYFSARYPTTQHHT